MIRGFSSANGNSHRAVPNAVKEQHQELYVLTFLQVVMHLEIRTYEIRFKS